MATAVSAVEFIATYYSNQGQPIPKALLAEIKALEASCTNKDTVRSLNVILVDLGIIDTMSAIVRMDDFDDEEWQ